MGQTAMQKILASHTGKKSVEPGEFILAKVDLAMANDITAPIAIKALEKHGITKLWDKERIAIVFSHFVPAKDILSAAQAAVAREFCLKYDISLFFDEGRVNLLSLEDERHKHRLASSLFVGRQARKTLASVDKLFNCEVQALILWHAGRPQVRRPCPAILARRDLWLSGSPERSRRNLLCRTVRRLVAAGEPAALEKSV